ncbi:helix-turn-helix domain-containing protein [Blastomonas sp.]|uniref:helix-turn-helix domain-containing protein n=1 Tax=Blastomonas sp. TaxID=1909299 RepID=UPI003593FB14
MSDPNVPQSNVANAASDNEPFTVQRGSGNVFADLGFADADTMALKSSLAIRLAELIKQRKMTQTDAARITGIDQPNLSRVLRGKLKDFSSDRLVKALNLLEADIEITVSTRGQKIGDTIVLASTAAETAW